MREASSAAKVGSLTVEPSLAPSSLSPLDFSLEVITSGPDITLNAHYNASLFSSKRASLMLEQIEQLLEVVTKDADAGILSASLITPSQISVIPDPSVHSFLISISYPLPFAEKFSTECSIRLGSLNLFIHFNLEVWGLFLH